MISNHELKSRILPIYLCPTLIDADRKETIARGLYIFILLLILCLTGRHAKHVIILFQCNSQNGCHQLVPHTSLVFLITTIKLQCSTERYFCIHNENKYIHVDNLSYKQTYMSGVFVSLCKRNALSYTTNYYSAISSCLITINEIFPIASHWISLSL